MFVGPLLAVGVIAVYWDKVGKPMLSGVSVLILLILVQASLSRLFSKFRSDNAIKLLICSTKTKNRSCDQIKTCLDLA